MSTLTVPPAHNGQGEQVLLSLGNKTMKVPKAFVYRKTVKFPKACVCVEQRDNPRRDFGLPANDGNNAVSTYFVTKTTNTLRVQEGQYLIPADLARLIQAGVTVIVTTP